MTTSTSNSRRKKGRKEASQDQLAPYSSVSSVTKKDKSIANSDRKNTYYNLETGNSQQLLSFLENDDVSVGSKDSDSRDNELLNGNGDDDNPLEMYLFDQEEEAEIH